MPELVDNSEDAENTNGSGDKSSPNPNKNSINQNKALDNMEVHHHAHGHDKKNWKSYIWEFIMLFLAVFCGYLAEYKLEHAIEHKREKEFIVSMIEDAKYDTANIRIAIDKNRIRLRYIDTLVLACNSFKTSRAYDYKIYALYRKLMSFADVMNPTERTLVQLKYSGGMRMIRNRKVADDIILYDKLGKQLYDQELVAEKFHEGTLHWAYELMNFNAFKFGASKGVDTAAKLLEPNPAKLLQFGNRVVAYGGVLHAYIYRLQNVNNQAIHLINTLPKEYKLEEND